MWWGFSKGVGKILDRSRKNELQRLEGDGEEVPNFLMFAGSVPWATGGKSEWNMWENYNLFNSLIQFSFVYTVFLCLCCYFLYKKT